MANQDEFKTRLHCALFVLGCIGLGLSTRKIDSLPMFLREHAGDALWAAMVYWGIAFLFPRASTVKVAVGALAFSFSIEASQLITHPLLEQARSTTLGALVLGHGFLWIDLVRYAVGVALAAGIDCLIQRRATHQ